MDLCACAQIYDVSHNIAKVEEHMVDGKQKRLLVRSKSTHWSGSADSRNLTPLYSVPGLC